MCIQFFLRSVFYILMCVFLLLCDLQMNAGMLNTTWKRRSWSTGSKHRDVLTTQRISISFFIFQFPKDCFRNTRGKVVSLRFWLNKFVYLINNALKVWSPEWQFSLLNKVSERHDLNLILLACIQNRTIVHSKFYVVFCSWSSWILKQMHENNGQNWA